MSTETKAGHPKFSYDQNKEKLLADLKVVVADAEQMITEAAGASNEGFATLRMRFESKLDEARAKLGQARTAMSDKTHQASAAAQDYVTQNPWQSAGVLAAAGVVFGFCLGRQSGGPDVEVPHE